MKNIAINLALLLLVSGIAPFDWASAASPITAVPKSNKLLDRVKRTPIKKLPELPAKDKVNELSEQIEANAASLGELANLVPVVLNGGLNAEYEKRVEGGFVAIANQWVGLLTKAQLQLVLKLPVSDLQQHHYQNLDMTMVSFRVPDELDSFKKMAELLPAEVMAKLDRNHVFAPQNDPVKSKTKEQAQATSVTNGGDAICRHPISVGMVDTAIESNHPYLKQSQIITKNFLNEEFAVPTDHATAVVGRFISHHPEASGVAPNAKIYAASVFYHRVDSTQGATVLNLVNGLNWLAEQNIKVVNLSLTGPDNKILLAVVSQLINQGFSLIAAAGNQGPASPPLYPAAYQGVIAVSAIDRQQNLYRWANQGSYIDFSALGVEVLTTQANQSIGEESGTSLAAPVVAAKMACQRFQHSQSHRKAKAALIKNAIDVGAPGFDKQYGHGIIE